LTRNRLTVLAEEYLTKALALDIAAGRFTPDIN